MKNPIKLEVDFIDPPTWFTNSMIPIQETVNERGYARYRAFKLYELRYQIKLIFDEYRFVRYAEFPSQEEATLFVMKWS